MKKLWTVLFLTLLLAALFTVMQTAYAQAPRLTSPEPYEVYTGTCGDNANWSLNTGTHVLSITGTGAISDNPWTEYVNSVYTINIGNGITKINDHIFEDHSMVTSVSLGNTLETIESCAFKNCDRLTSIVIPNSVRFMYGGFNDGAFAYCDGLESVQIGSGLEALGRDSFRSCINLRTVTIANGAIGTIGQSAFEGCSSLNFVRIGNNITGIDSYAFYNCPLLSSLIIGSRVKNIGDKAFGECPALTNVFFLGDAPTTITDGDSSYQSFDASRVILRYLPEDFDWTTPTWHGYNTSPFNISELPQAVTPGDADGNGVVNANDALMVLRYALGLISSIDTATADVDGNGVVNANDALTILRAALGLATL